MTEKKSFILYSDYEETMQDLTVREKGILMANLFHYANGKALDKMPRTVEIVFNIIRRQMDRDGEKYEVVAERNRKNGAKGGRPSKEKDADVITQNNPENPDGFESAELKPRKPDNENEKETGNENDSVSVNGNEKEQPQPQDCAAVPASPEAHTHTQTQEPKISYARYVTLTKAEHAALTAQFGEQVLAGIIRVVSDYKGLRPGNYKDYGDFYAIKGWGYERYQRECARNVLASPKLPAPGGEGNVPSSYDRDELEEFWNTR